MIQILLIEPLNTVLEPTAIAPSVPHSPGRSFSGVAHALDRWNRQDFMRISHMITGAALMAAFCIGCSKSPSHPTSRLPAGTKDLGVIEFTEGTPLQFSLGGGRGCTATAKRNNGGNIEVDFSIVSTNADGTVSDFARPSISTSPGRQCVVSVGEVSIGLVPKWKTP